jgi:hypothetical protein
MKPHFGKLTLLAIIAATPGWTCALETAGPGLIVSGKVISIEEESNESWRLKYQASIEIHYVNVSGIPIILAKNDQMYLSDAYAEWDDAGGAIFSSRETADELLYQRIDEPAPPPDATVTLPPKGEYVVRTKVVLDLSRSAPDDEHLRSKSLPASLRLTLNPWHEINANSKSPQVEDMRADELRAYLEARWAAFGHIAPEEVDSEPIQFN